MVQSSAVSLHAFLEIIQLSIRYVTGCRSLGTSRGNREKKKNQELQECILEEGNKGRVGYEPESHY